jgi:hypothetical protein
MIYSTLRTFYILAIIPAAFSLVNNVGISRGDFVGQKLTLNSRELSLYAGSRVGFRVSGWS